MKKKLVIFLSLFILMCSFINGCSNNSISNIEIIEDSVKRDYIVGEEVNINNFELKITYKNNKEEYYYISNEKIKLNEIDNTKVGNQKLEISFNYNKTNVNLNLVVNFALPGEVIELIDMIDELPDISEITFDYNENIDLIKSKYELLSDFYKNYVSNYSELITKEEYLNNLHDEVITADFISYRNNVKLNLTRYYNSLNRADYYNNEWLEIENIYTQGLLSIMKDSNYSKISYIYSSTIEDINNVKTAYDIILDANKEEVKKKILDYRETLDNSLYSENNVYILDIITKKYIETIDSISNEESLNSCYNEAISSLNDVNTLEDDRRENINMIIEEKTNELNVYYISINFTKYSASNKRKIMNKYSETIKLINSSESETEMNAHINNFKRYVNGVYTIDMENEIILNDYKTSSIKYIDDIYNSLNLDLYDTSNVLNIKNKYEFTLKNISSSSTIEMIDLEKINFENFVNSISTMN